MVVDIATPSGQYITVMMVYHFENRASPLTALCKDLNCITFVLELPGAFSVYLPSCISITLGFILTGFNATTNMSWHKKVRLIRPLTYTKKYQEKE